LFRKKKLLLALLIICLMVAFSMVGCGSEDSSALNEDETLSTDPLVIRLEGQDFGFPSPFAHYPRGRGTVMKYLFDSLLEIDEEGYIPWLAEEWVISEDGKEHLVTLRPEIKWQDGRDLTVADVVFSFNYYQQFPPVFIGEEIMNREFLISVEAVNDNQVKFVTAEPSGTFYMEAGVMRIIPQHIWADVEDPYSFTEPEATMGCGPYILTDYSQEHNSYRYEAFEEYWGPMQAVDVLEMIPVSEAVLALEKGDIDLARIPPDTVSRFKESPEFAVVSSPALAGYLLSFNFYRSDLFANPLFRQALAYAIDKDELIEKIARGGAKPGSPGILPIDHQWYNPLVKNYSLDLEKAKAMLIEAGVTGNTTYELLVGEGVEVRIGELLKEQLAKAGITINVVSADTKSRDARVFEGNYELALLAMGSWGLDADWLRIRYSSLKDDAEAGGSASALLGADQGYANAELDDLFDRQKRETDQAVRKALFFEIQELLALEVPEIPLYNNYYYYAYRPGLYDGWTFMFDHPVMEHAKLSFLERK
jgi:peptide/nickel transport system substrate-binding protein